MKRSHIIQSNREKEIVRSTTHNYILHKIASTYLQYEKYGIELIGGGEGDTGREEFLLLQEKNKVGEKEERIIVCIGSSE